MRKWLIGLAAVGVIGFGVSRVARTEGVTVPSPAVDAQLAAPGAPMKVAVVAGGCFWGIRRLSAHARREEGHLRLAAAKSTARYEMVRPADRPRPCIF